MTFDPSPPLEIISKCIIDLSARAETIKPLEENIGLEVFVTSV